MKKIYLIFVSFLIFASCGNRKEATIENVISSGNIKKIKTKKKELIAKQKVIREQLDSLNTEIARLDTIKKLPLVSTFVTEKTVFDHYFKITRKRQHKTFLIIF